ncbi:MAG TPA: tRNA uridine-5-carboxymethylaminomethyl(34) synthesis GTPase MnmE, partial [Porphyromonadaceae bacterium]|nr:tRNA uridine-5-carboxymethylaminomethyl(34) synthesis GTPase MnmE [Porphyromonadaceae bacterium]
MEDSTICAISTANGIGGVAIIRVSGKEAIKIGSRFFFPLNPLHTLEKRKTHSLTYGIWKDKEGEIIDEVVVGLYLAPHSFTREDTIEINCHGSFYIQQKILFTLIEGGCKMAQPGEFTQRAFLNGGIDLSQAEAVADLISATSSSAHKVALNQMRGGIKDCIAGLRKQLLEVTSLIELELDFSEEDVEFANREQLMNLCKEIESVLQRLTQSFSSGNAIKNGFSVAIVGATNVGKSTLLNGLLNEERSIVSNIHGTTRDIIEDTMIIGGQLFRFIDTAGIRESKDIVENMGIERTKQKMKQVDLILWLLDGSIPFSSQQEILGDIQREEQNGVPLCILVNKKDLMSCMAQKEYFSGLKGKNFLLISAKEGEGLAELREELLQASRKGNSAGEEIILTNVRHYEALHSALGSILRVEEGLGNHLSGELVSIDLRECLHYLGEVSGEITSEDVLHNIFSKFCIGK